MVVLGAGAVCYERGTPVVPLPLAPPQPLARRGRVRPFVEILPGYLAHRKQPPPWDHRGALDRGLL